MEKYGTLDVTIRNCSVKQFNVIRLMLLSESEVAVNISYLRNNQSGDGEITFNSFGILENLTGRAEIELLCIERETMEAPSETEN